MPPFENWDKFEDDEDDELGDESFYQGRRDAVLFAIDCSESMLKLRDDGRGNQKSHLQVALEGCRDLQKRKAHVGPNDSVGILVFNTARHYLLRIMHRVQYVWQILPPPRLRKLILEERKARRLRITVMHSNE
jgi:hypothetical protein